MRQILIMSAIAACLFLAGCASPPPEKQTNICQIFQQYPKWYEHATEMHKDWGTPIHLAMAFIKQESGFVHDARPPKKYKLGFVPWGRVSSAYGYAQALDGTWDDFQKATNKGGQRTDFSDALHFIGWYTSSSRTELKLPYTDVYSHYLAYHEGRGGFKRGRHVGKTLLLNVAKKVSTQANMFKVQLSGCQAQLEKNRRSWFNIF